MRRRTYLGAVAAGLAAGAGCSSIQGGDADDPETATDTPASTPTEPDVALLEAAPSELEFDDGETVDIHVEVRNDGAAGEVPLEVTLGDEPVVERTMPVDSGRHVEAVTIDAVADGYYEYTVAVGDQTESGTFTVGTPVEKPQVVTRHTVLGQADRSNSRADRLHVDLEVPADPYNGVAPPDRAELLDICRKLILDALESKQWDVVRFDVWRQTQRDGEGAPHATVTWGPDGDWSGVGAGAAGDYSSHAFNVTGAPYLVTRGVEDVETDRWAFTVEFDIVNQGLERAALQGVVSTPQTDPQGFAVDLEPGERSTVRYEDAVFGVANRTHYTIETDEEDPLYGPRSAEIRFS